MQPLLGATFEHYNYMIIIRLDFKVKLLINITYAVKSLIY